MRGEPGAGSGAVRPISDFLRPDEIVSAVEAPQLPLSDARGIEEVANRAERIPEMLRARDRWLSEVNLQRLPFAVLWDKRTGSKEPIVVEETYLRDGESVTRRWQVTPGSKFGLPGPSAYATFRALEKIMLSRTIQRGIPLSNPQEFQIQEILRELDLAGDKDNYARIKNDLRRIKACDFIDEGFLRKKRTKQTAAGRAPRGATEARFSLISGLLFKFNEFPDGTTARTNFVWFQEFYMDSVNSGYVKPLDWDLWKSLRRPAARRIYELIDLRMFATPRAPVVEFDYDELTQLLPVKRDRYLSFAKKTLGGPLKELCGSILSDFGWKCSGTEWRVRLTPAEAYRKRLLQRRGPEFDPRALELAQALGDPRSIRLYQQVVSSVPRGYIDMALSETRMAAKTGETDHRVRNQGAYFTTALSGILQRRGLPLPFERKSASGRMLPVEAGGRKRQDPQ